ncbi:MAG: FeoB-associated Cys-rich membrane protein [Bacillota bacterium]
MNVVDLVAGLIVASLLGLAIFYIVKAKKSGQKCIGCPHSKTCSQACSCKSEENKNNKN